MVLETRRHKWKTWLRPLTTAGALMAVLVAAGQTAQAAQYTAIGDSLTFGANATPGNRFTDILTTQLNAQGGGFTQTNFGEFGAPAPQIVSNQLAPALATTPDLVTLTAGTNDARAIAQGTETLSDFDAALNTILSSLRAGAPGRLILLSNVPDLSQLPAANDNPLTPGDPADGYAPDPITKAALTGLVQQLNTIISTRAGEQGATVVDLFNNPASYNPANISADGVHPNDAGHAALAGLFSVSSSLVVTTTSDVTAADGETTLREAITAAATAGGTPSVTFAGDLTGTIALTGGELAIGTSMNIVGPGASLLTVSGGNTSRIFNISAGTVAISGLTVSGGRAVGTNGTNGGTSAVGTPGGNGQGGAIRNAGTLSLNACVLTANTAVGGTGGVGGPAPAGNNNSAADGGNGGSGQGGAIYNAGTLNVVQSTLNANTASGSTGGNGGSAAGGSLRFGGDGGDGGNGQGGAIYSTAGFTLTNSTISGNTTTNGSAGNGGPGSSVITNGSAGSAGIRQGGGIYATGATTISSATITLNTVTTSTGANGGSGIFRTGGSLVINNSIVANNTPNTDNIDGGNTGANNITSGNPQLGALADNGGPTPTHALLAGSPALNNGSSALPTDQRGLPRPSGSGVDIGAFEAQAPALDLNGGAAGVDSAVTFTEDGGSVPLVDTAATLTDADGANLTGATVALTATPNGTDESLAADTTGTAITASYNSGTRVLTLSGTDTLANYLQVLKTVTYDNNSQDPDTTDRVATFTVNDGIVTSTATSTITVVAVNDAPVFTKGADETVAEDSGPQTVAGWATGISAVEAGQTVSFLVSNDKPALFTTPPAINATGDLTYETALNANGVVTVTVRVQDDGGTANGGVDTSAPQTFTITITPVNDAPVATDKNFTINEDTTLPFALPVSDVDPDTLTYTIIDQPDHGQLTGTAPNLTYTPNQDYYGTDFFTFKANDGTVDSNVGRVSFLINPVNDAPVAQNQSVGTAEDTPVTVTLTANDPDSASLTYTIVTQPSHGVLSGTGANRLYTPAANFTGTDSFTFKANDGNLDSNVATVTITVGGINDAPVAVNDEYEVDEDASTKLSVLANDSDPDGTSPSIVRVAVTGLAHGTVAINADGTLLYTPETNYTGLATFNYTITDGSLEDTATVTITVRRIDPAPVAEDDSYVVESALLSVAAPGVLANDSDAESQPLTAGGATLPAHGTLTLNSNGSFSYRPTPGFVGEDSFTYLISDGTSTDTATVKLTVRALPKLTLTIAPASFFENDGPAAAIGTLTRNVGLGQSLTVNLGSTDEGEVKVPAQVRFPATIETVTFPIAAIDDAQIDGPQNATIKATAVGYPAATATVRVLDNGRNSLALTLKVETPAFSEAAGNYASKAEVSIGEPAKVDYVITLVSSDPSEAKVPATATILAGRSSASFYIGAVNDRLADGIQAVYITAKRRGFTTAAQQLRVSDDDVAALSLKTSSTTLREGSSVQATVGHNLPDTGGITVRLSSSDPSVVPVPSVVTIVKGASTVNFTLSAADNGQVDESREVTITASRTGLRSATATINVVDATGVVDNAKARTSRVALSTASGSAATSSIKITFDGGLDAGSITAAAFTAAIGGSPVAVEAVSYDAATSTVTLVLADGSVSAGDSVKAAWSGLLDTSGGALKGQTTVTVK